MSIQFMTLPTRRTRNLVRCPDCGEVYEGWYSFYCPQSEGLESDDAQCPTFECVEAREAK